MKQPSDIRYVAHLARDANRFETACGEPWQGWQEPAGADRHTPADRYLVVPPHDPPRPHVDPIRQCQACLRVAREWAETQPSATGEGA